MARRKRAKDVPDLPFTVAAHVGSHVVHVTFADDGSAIRHVEHHGDPACVSGPDRERLAANVIAANDHLDLKTDHPRVYDALWAGNQT